MRRVDRSICRNLALAGHREWLETNGIGGYASSTITGLNTRRYHGLLVAATKPPVGRLVLLSKLEETLVIGGRRYELSCNRYPGAIHPQGHLFLKEFRQDPFPVFVYQVDDAELEKSIFLVHGENTAVIQYTYRGPAASLELRPLVAFRDYHALTHQNSVLNPAVILAPGLAECRPYPDLPKLSLAHTDAIVDIAGDWYRNFEYPAEQARGLDFHEDLWKPFELTFDLAVNPNAAVIASTEPHDASAAPQLRAAEIARRPADPLAHAADQFLVARGDDTTVIAGYHWFADWGRDTMISLPGLTLATGRYDAARSILSTFAAHADQGMLPNRFPDAGEAPEYNTVDATLWFFEAVRKYLAHTGDAAFVRGLYPVLADMIAWHECGTRFGIHVDSDGLLAAGAAGVQLTWMDAKVGEWVVTPRSGKPVEIQALWYNALRIMEDLARQFGDSGQAHYAQMAARARASFEPLFWNPAEGCLYDVVDGANRDASIRPNQIFAVSLSHQILSAERAAMVLAVVERDLLTPYGLRTLAPQDPNYRGVYEGDVRSRDGAYHQGTVWPWLLGPFLDAHRKIHGASPKAAECTAELRRYFDEEGLGQLPEIFDGDPPHRPRGCIAQAWSVANLSRAEKSYS